MSSSAAPQLPEAPWVLFRIQLPSMWDESLVWLLAEHDFGSASADTTYPAGMVATALPSAAIPSAAWPCEVCVSVAAPRAPALRAALPIWLAQLGLTEQDWHCHEQPHDVAAYSDPSLWQQAWKPFRCAGYVVHSDFHALKTLSLRATDIPLTLKTGSAFGTGSHPTTRLALKTLHKWCADGPPPRLLDVGTGSGILSVAAALGGVKEVVGMDPDPFSAAQANAMAALNGVSSACSFWRGGFESAAGQWPAVVANLVANIIQEGAGSLGRLVAPGGKLFAGGILECHWEATASALAAQDLKILSRSGCGRWLAGIWVKS